MKPDRLIAKVRCKCGNVITIRTYSDKTKVGVSCWAQGCTRSVYFVMRGWMKAQGKCIDTDGETVDVECWIDLQEQS